MSLTLGTKTYSNLHLITLPLGRFIKKPLSKTEQIFYGRAQNFPFILRPDYIKNGYAYYRYLPQGNIAHCSKNLFIQAVEDIADFHARLAISNWSFLPSSLVSRREELEKIRSLLVEGRVTIAWSRFEKVASQLVSIAEKYAAVCHGDFIALNVLRSGENIKITDWEYVCIDFAEADIGRLLGDLFYEQPSFTHRYYDFSWHDELAWKYLEARKANQPMYDMELGMERVFLGELYNYLGPILACLEQGDCSSRWFLENLGAFNNSAIPLHQR